MKDCRDTKAAAGITVLITTHNRPALASRALASVLQQTRAADEVIVVDDGSTPPYHPSGLASEFQNRILLIRNEHATGAAAARNAGIRAASQPWIAFLDDDDQFVPHKLERVVEAIQGLREPVAVLYHPALIRLVNERLTYPTVPLSQPPTAMFRALLVRNLVGGTPMVVARREALQRAGLFDESLRALEDYELWLRLAKGGEQFHLIPSLLTTYDCVTRATSLTKSEEAGISTFDRIHERYATDYDDLGASEILEHRMWIDEVLLQRAVLRLDRWDTLRRASGLLSTYGRVRHLVALIGACVGPSTILRLRALSSQFRATGK